ncbi:acyl-CoA dehydrogenase family protein [Streptomyces sp. NPDC050560]|uniref:acyl-CoA dehydrogenase family protein n=1 Tax=Streptomyces sp. NPDC050560 TaxID=3365630 RepID=UPI003793D12D
MLSYPRPSHAPEDLPDHLRPAIEKYRDDAEDLRRLPSELVDVLRASGAFRLNTPRELGGFELPVATSVALIERLARIDGSTAWTVWNFNVGFAAAFLGEAGAERVWSGGQDPMIAHSSQPGHLVPSHEGFLLSGEWKLVSGADAAQWVALLALVLDDGQPRITEAGPDVRFCLIPRSSAEVRDTWHSTGLRGTDSNTVIARDVPVESDMTLAPGATARIDRPLFRVPVINQLTSGGAAVTLGLARAAMEEMAELSRTKTGPDGVPLAQQPRIQAALGQAGARVDAALALLLTTLGRLDAAAAAGRQATEAERGAVRGALPHAGETARAVLTSMYELAGSAVLYESNRLGKLFRDGHAAAQHAILSATNYELAGRTVLGIPGADPFL